MWYMHAHTHTHTTYWLKENLSPQSIVCEIEGQWTNDQCPVYLKRFRINFDLKSLCRCMHFHGDSILRMKLEGSANQGHVLNSTLFELFPE